MSPARPAGRRVAIREASPSAAAISSHAWSNRAGSSSGPGVPSTATSAAMPSTAPIWRAHEESAVPVARRFGGSSITEAVASAANAMPNAAPETSCAGSQSVKYAGSTPVSER